MMFYTHYSRTLIATGFTGHISTNTLTGDKYYEFDDSHIVKDNIKQKWKGTPKKSVYYIWWVSNDKEQIKIYQQLKPVGYADYKPGKWYIFTEDLITQ